MAHEPGDQNTEATFRRRTLVSHRISLMHTCGSVLAVVRDLQDRPLVVVQWERGHVGVSKPFWLNRLSSDGAS